MDRLKLGTCDTSLFPFYLRLDPFPEKCYLGFLTKHSSMPVLQEELQMSGADRWSASDYYVVTTLWFNTQTMENLFTVASFCRLSTVIRIRQTASAFWPKQTNKQTKWALEQRLDCTQSLCFWLIYAVRIAAIKRKDQTIDYQTISGDWNQTDCLFRFNKLTNISDLFFLQISLTSYRMSWHIILTLKKVEQVKKSFKRINFQERLRNSHFLWFSR